jgi:hypothetical protein
MPADPPQDHLDDTQHPVKEEATDEYKALTGQEKYEADRDTSYTQYDELLGTFSVKTTFNIAYVIHDRTLHHQMVGPAVSQKELERALHEGVDSPQIQGLHKLKARIDIICDYIELHTIDEFIKHCNR